VVQKALEALPGVVQAQVNGSDKTATCYVKKEEFDVEQAITALADAGYNNSTVME
jgi:copper chaperone CopZ